MNQFTYAEQLQSIKDVIQQHDDGLITGFETFGKIQEILGKVDQEALKSEHESLMADEE